MRIKLNVPLSLSEIADAVSAELIGDDAPISFICTDSREVQANDLFVALEGAQYDGNSFSQQVINSGGFVLGTGLANIIVDDTRKAILDLVHAYKQKLPCLAHTIAITGSVGKTTTKELAARLLSSKFKVHANLGNYNNDVGLLHTVLSADISTEVMIVEMGMNHKGEISSLSRAVEPDIAIITNIGTAHIGNLGSRENIAAAKLEITDGMKSGLIIVPGDEPLLRNVHPRYEINPGENGAGSVFSIKEADGISTKFCFAGKNISLPDESVALRGKHLMNALAFALSVADLTGLEPHEIRASLKNINSSCLRQRYMRIGKYKIYDDTYSSSAEAMIAVIDAMTHQHGAVSAVIGDMLELGESSADLHKKIGRYAASVGVRKLYLFGEFAELIAEGAYEAGIDRSAVFINNNVDLPQKTAEQIQRSYEGELLIVKASHAVRAERIYEFLKD